MRQSKMWKQSIYYFAVFSSGMDRLYGSAAMQELSTKASIVDPVDFIKAEGYGNSKKKPNSLFIGRNNTEIWAHAGSNVVFDCLVGKPDLQDQGPVSYPLNTNSCGK